MTNLTDTTATVQEQYVDAVRQSQELAVKGVQSWADTVTRFVPSVPGLDVDQSLGNPGELVDQGFDFAERLLAVQRQFAHELLDAAAPVREKVEPARR